MRDALPVVVVGAGLAGLRVAEAIRRAGSDRPITVLGEEPHPPYNRTPLSKSVEGTSAEQLRFPLRSSIDDVVWRTGTRAVGADLEARTVRDSSGDELRYGALVIASGVRPRRLGLNDENPSGRTALRTIEDAEAIRAATTRHARVVIAGGGFIAAEVAAFLRSVGCDVTVVTAGRHPLERVLGMPFAADLQQRHERSGVRFITGATVVGVERAGDRLAAVVTSAGESRPCDLLVEAVGAEPNTEWLGETALDLSRGVRTDGALRALCRDGSVAEGVFAVGDVAAFPHPLFQGDHRRIEHWNIPTDTGQRAGKVIAAGLGGDTARLQSLLDEPFAPVPTFWSDQGDIHLLAYGIPSLGEPRLLAGEPGADCVYGYFDGDRMVGVCGIGHRTELMAHRGRIAAGW